MVALHASLIFAFPDKNMFIWMYRSVKAILCGCGTRIYLCGCHARFLKNRVSHPFFLIVLKGFTTVFNDGIDNGSPLDVAIIPNHDGNDSVVSYSHMRT